MDQKDGQKGGGRNILYDIVTDMYETKERLSQNETGDTKKHEIVRTKANSHHRVYIPPLHSNGISEQRSRLQKRKKKKKHHFIA